MSRLLEERVLVLAPRGEMSRVLTTEAGVLLEEFPDLGRLAAALAEGAGAVLLTEGWEGSPGRDRFLAQVEAQPAWSELPVLIFAPPNDAAGHADLLRCLGNLTLLEPPLRVSTLVTTVQSAVRSRRRQYQIREHLREREASEAALREGEERLRFSLEAGKLGFWQHDLLTDAVICSDRCKEHFGRSPDKALTHNDILASVHPEDLEGVKEAIRRAILEGDSYVLEYRVLWPNGSARWVMVRGRAIYTEGRPTTTYGITLDITERKETEESLRQAGRAKDQFLAMLAHELRNPLAPITSALGVMRARPSREQGEKARQLIERQMAHMSRLIDDLLDVSRINSGKITLKRERVDLVEAVERALEGVRDFITQSGHALESILPRRPLQVEVDPVRLEQVVVNLLNNAAKYTEPGGRISVTLDRVGEKARLSVRDTGIGMGPELLPHVFELFTQGERGLDRSQGGLGLGLSLVQNIVRMHGGTVEAHSEGPGTGSEFVVTLPLALPAAEAVAAPEGPASAVAAARGAAVQGAAGVRRLLVVDDNRDSADTLAELAQIWGFESEAAYDGLSALRKAEEWEPAFVLMDIGMPGMSGYEVARRLREDSRFAGATFVALTGYGRAEDREQSQAAGFNHHVVKPVDAAELRELLLAGS